MNGHNKVEKTTFWKMTEAREGPDRRRFREKEICRTVASHKKAVRKSSFAVRVQDPWNQLADTVRKPETQEPSDKLTRKLRTLHSLRSKN